MIARGLLCRVCCHAVLFFVGCLYIYKAIWNLYRYKRVEGHDEVLE